MAKPWRCRRPLLPMLPFPFHVASLGIRLRIGKRVRRRIQRRASMVKNVGGSPHRSPVLASSEVESASMSDQFEIRRFDDAQQHHIGLVRPGDIADDRDVVEANTAQASGPSSPRPDFSYYPDDFKSRGTDTLLPPCDPNHPSGLQQYKAFLGWFYGFHKRPGPPLSDYLDAFNSLGTDRLLPPFELNDPSHMEQYKAYVEWFYHFHKGPGPSASDDAIVDAASKCLEKEKKMRLWWKAKRAQSSAFLLDFTLSEHIVDSMHDVIVEVEDFLPFAVDACPCIAKEAELITEWLTKRGLRYLADEEYVLCHRIRWIAHDLFCFPGEWSIYIAAALLGIRKEAEWLIENIKLGSVESVSTSMKIRQSAYDFIEKIWSEYPPSIILEESSEIASERDEDVSAIQEDDFTWFVNIEELDSGYKKASAQAVRVS